MPVGIANREDPDLSEEQSDLGMCCLSRSFCQATAVFKILEHLPYSIDRYVAAQNNINGLSITINCFQNMR